MLNYNIDNQNTKQIYGSITLLDLDGYPIERIEGKITSGTVSIDSRSAVRRTCQLTFLPGASETYTDFLWGLEKLFKLEVGVFDESKERIKWYPQGVYIISQFQVSKSTNNLTINLSGKDKMCRLNGEVSGLIDSSASDLDKLHDNNGNTTSLTIKEIIRNLVYEFGEEPYHNIIINDLQEYAVELLEYRYNVPMFVYKSENNETNYLDNIIISGEKQCKIDNNEYILKKLESDQLTLLDNIDNPREEDYKVTFDGDETIKYAVAKIDYGTVAGYQRTELVYPDGNALTANIGEPVTSLLDKIVKVLGGNYEYFYNLDGQFVFQLKESFTKTMWGNKDYIHDKDIYDFTQGAYLISLSNTPDIANLKNDFSIWGENEAGLPIHFRYAIDEKPQIYKSIREPNIIYATNRELADKHYPTEKYIICDWREILYQMADDYFKEHYKENFTQKLRENNPNFFPLGKTKYEQYYRDIQGFWRDLYLDPIPKEIENEEWSDEEIEQYYMDGSNKYWNKDVFENPQKLKFFIDFLDTGSIQRFSVRKLGRKPYVEQQNTIKAIDYIQAPYLIFVDPTEEKEEISGYKQVQMQHIDYVFTKTRRGTSAKEAMEQCLYKYAYCNEAVNITCSPIFDLHPNSSILLKDKDAQVDGEYIVDKITLSLNYNGNMSITAIKAAEEEVML